LKGRDDIQNILLNNFKKTMEGEDAESYVDKCSQYIKSLKKQNKALQDEIAELKAENEKLKSVPTADKTVEQLVSTVKDLKATIASYKKGKVSALRPVKQPTAYSFKLAQDLLMGSTEPPEHSGDGSSSADDSEEIEDD
jgi:cell division protein FtsB